MLRSWFLSLPLLWMGVASASADDKLALPDVIARARAHAPVPVIARARTEEARASRVGARRLATRNPVLEADVGPRWADGRSTDAQVGLSLPLELGGRRDKRIAVAEAEIQRHVLEASNAERVTVASAVLAYFEVLHRDRRLALAEERVGLAEAAERTATQRNRAGDVAEFEVNLARGEVARARSAVSAAISDQIRARGQLAIVLGLPSLKGLTVVGDLADRSLLDRPVASAARPDVRTLEQELAVAKAEGALASVERFPAIDLRVFYQHERDADLLLGGAAITLPLFDHGQGEAARARARARRAELELTTRAAAVATELDTSAAIYAAAVEAVQRLEADALPLSAANETSAAASYRAGKTDLGTLLLIRREVLDTRREHLDRLLDAAIAAIELWSARGSGAPR